MGDDKRDVAFFGSPSVYMNFTAHAEDVMLRAFSEAMETNAYTQMTIELQDLLRQNVLKDEPFCFSGYHHSVMLLSALSKRLKRGPREHLFVALQGEHGLKHMKSYVSTRTDIVSDTLVRIDALQSNFSQSHSYTLFSRLKRLFPVVLKYAPNLDDLARSIDSVICPPKGFVYEGCHFGVRSKQLAGFYSQSRFYNDDDHQRPLEVDDDIVTRWQQKNTKPGKRDYYVLFNVGLRLRRGTRRFHFHTNIRIISFAVYDADHGRWIRPVLVRMPRWKTDIYSATMYTIFVFYLRVFNSTQLLLAGAAAVLYMLDHVSLTQLDRAIAKRDQTVLKPIYVDMSSLTT